MTTTNPSSIESLRFIASDVFTKFGFGDGDILDDILEDNGIDILSTRSIDDDEESLCHAIITEIVSRRLKPILPTEQFHLRYTRAHNPIRVRDTEENRKKLEGLQFDVSVSEILDVAAELAPQFAPRTTLTR